MTSASGSGGRRERRGRAELRGGRIREGCEIVLISSQVSGCGATTLGRQIATHHDWPFISCHAEMTVRALLNFLYEAIVRGGVGNFYQNFECFSAIVSELRDLGAPPLVIDNCFRLSPRLIDVVRDVGDASGAPLIFLCTREMRHTLVAPKSCSMEAVASRIVAMSRCRSCRSAMRSYSRRNLRKSKSMRS
jgi:hypothetical protein